MNQQLSRHGGDGRDFHGAAVVLPDGREIPITEAMVTEALESLEASWHRARRTQRAPSVAA